MNDPDIIFILIEPVSLSHAAKADALNSYVEIVRPLSPGQGGGKDFRYTGRAALGLQTAVSELRLTPPVHIG